MNVHNITARMILDSRGNPTVEAEVWCEGGSWGRASVPSGASTGTHEAHELRDGGAQYGGKGVSIAVNNIRGEIRDTLIGVPVDDQYRLDELMIQLDGTPNKSRLGANSILAVSLAAAHAAANMRRIPLYMHINDVAHNPRMSLPMPMVNVLNGGQHAAHSADFQECMIIPIGADSYRKVVEITTEIFHALKQVLTNHAMSTTVGDEGGFAPRVDSNRAMLEFLLEAVESAGYKPGHDVVFALDVAASELYTQGSYHLATENRFLSADELIEYLAELTKGYPVRSIEDGLDQDAWNDWKQLHKKLQNIQLVGDDLLVTNRERLQKAIKEKAANAILIKPNQIGTLTETIHTIRAAQESGWNTIVSHRSGETEDVTIAHLAVGTGAGQIKTGSVSRGERTAKYNELLRIEEHANGLVLSNPFTS